MVFNPKPNIQSSKQIEFSHNRQLIFPAGNEYHKFEILDVHQPGLNVDRIEWHDPHYHAVLFADKAAKNYVYDEDQNGAFIVRNTDDWEINTTSEYLFVHFMLSSPRLTGGDVYINGEWTGNQFSPEYKMTYNETLQAYETAILLKQGYYNYISFYRTAKTSATATKPTAIFMKPKMNISFWFINVLSEEDMTNW